ncbi:bifunctional protein GlmU [Clostridium homopropionicum DSM 5847]|uniref:Bifunctional protein GlmU n=1 Tax=Clostridium homopropionicum DSM 5847 TaxID=1121318 RepID=A0A0L6ZDI2_9CLOT|nr:phosphocholine cytidylyltransferase family protein [Clostridium homopropionicum]KOA21025.1 bifunctional protein GlmU [Clostridium homopropionicum DSM 5847]SFF99153.1 Choline kinase [Clostridium homopropionicum]
MKAIILAAGRGSRLGDITNDHPKCLTELFGKTLLDWQIEALNCAGISEIAIVRGYKKEKIDISNVIYFDNNNWDKTNMVMSLYEADEWLQKYECIVSYSDIIYKSKVIDLLKNNDSDISITYNTNWLKLWRVRFDDPLSDAESFKINSKGILVEIGKKTSAVSEIQGQYMGILKIKPDGWKNIKKYIDGLSEQDKNSLDMTTLLNRLIEKGINIYAIPSDEQWLEVDSKEDLNLYKRLFKVF